MNSGVNSRPRFFSLLSYRSTFYEGSGEEVIQMLIYFKNYLFSRIKIWLCMSGAKCSSFCQEFFSFFFCKINMDLLCRDRLHLTSQHRHITHSSSSHLWSSFGLPVPVSSTSSFTFMSFFLPKVHTWKSKFETCFWEADSFCFT